MIDRSSKKAIPEVPRLIYEAFIEELTQAGTEAELVKRLKSLILEEGLLSVTALRTSMFPDETL